MKEKSKERRPGIGDEVETLDGQLGVIDAVYRKCGRYGYGIRILPAMPIPEFPEWAIPGDAFEVVRTPRQRADQGKGLGEGL